MNADELEKVLEGRLVAQCAAKPKQPAEDEFRLLQKVFRAAPPTTHTVPQAHRGNRFSALELQVPEALSECEEEMPEPTETQPRPPPDSRRSCGPKWEKWMSRKLVIHSLEEGPNCIMLPIHLKTTDTMEEASTEAMVDTGATGDFID